MNTQEIEKETLAYLDRTSVMETLASQYYIFLGCNKKHPQLIQVSNRLQAAIWRELVKETGCTLDEIARTAIHIEGAVVQFMPLQPDCYARLFAPGCETQIL